jgi:hypothetical protein
MALLSISDAPQLPRGAQIRTNLFAELSLQYDTAKPHRGPHVDRLPHFNQPPRSISAGQESLNRRNGNHLRYLRRDSVKGLNALRHSRVRAREARNPHSIGAVCTDETNAEVLIISSEQIRTDLRHPARAIRSVRGTHLHERQRLPGVGCSVHLARSKSLCIGSLCTECLVRVCDRLPVMTVMKNIDDKLSAAEKNRAPATEPRQKGSRFKTSDEPPLAQKNLGFRNGASSVHTSRTMMLDELSRLLDTVPATSHAVAYQTAVVDENVLGKPTQSTRQRTAKRLRELYALDPQCTLFRSLRRFWAGDNGSRPMLALLAAVARDPILRDMTPFVVSVPIGSEVSAVQIDEQIKSKYPGRFSDTTRRSTAQNLAASWTQAGLLQGKVRKVRTKPKISPAVAAFAVLLGYLSGFRGKLLLDSAWTRILDGSAAEVTALVVEASRQGWVTYKAAGNVVEITFPGLLTPLEEQATRDAD